jgi:Zn-finger protein
MPEPKDTTKTAHFKGFTNTKCEFFPCHTGVENPEENFNCLFCYCALAHLECCGPYEVFTDANGIKRKDCSACRLNHDGIEKSWKFIQRWLQDPKPWNGEPQTERRMRAAVHVEHPRNKQNQV